MSIKDWGVLPNGSYKFRCSAVEVKTSVKGNPYIEWKIEVIEPSQFEGEELILTNSLGKKRYSMQIAKAWLLAFGCGEEDDPPVEEPSAFTEYLQKCVGKVAYGNLTTKVDDYGTKNVIIPPDGIFSVQKEEPAW